MSLLENDSFLNDKFIVYHDKNYHQSWIDRDSTVKIVDFFSSTDRSITFTTLDAEQICNWVTKRITNTDLGFQCKGTVIIFSQDMIPDTLAKNPSPNTLIRKYLDNGGRIVWIGEVPFWRQGKKNIGTFELDIPKLAQEQRDSTQKNEPKYWIEWNIGGIFSILGLNCEFNNAPADMIQITKDGKYMGLKTSWYGTRPIPENKGDDILVLGSSAALKFKPPSLLNPEDKSSNLDERLSSISTSLTAVFTLLAILTGLGTTTIVTDWLQTNQLTSSIPWIRGFVILFVLIYVYKDQIHKIYPKKYTNAWVKVYNKKYPYSGFIRIWDKLIYNLTENELEELYKITTINL